MNKISREDRIRIRSEMYVNGEIDLDQFYSLESDENDDEEDHPEEELSLLELDHKKRSEQAQEDAPIVSIVDAYETPSLEAQEDLSSVIKSLTKEGFNTLSIFEQQKLYSFDPEKIESLFSDKPSELTVEAFRSMSIQDLNDLYRTDPDQYNRLRNELVRRDLE